MPISQNPKETGWFYHAPAKKRVNVERVDYPAPSNIPGIGFDEPSSQEPEEVREMMFKETDSDYIRLAKMGGRKDLLAFTPEKFRGDTQGKEPKGYPRNDWFYLEDNRMEDEEKKREEDLEWQFMLPEYMVHKSYKPSFNEPGSTPTREAAPYHTDKHSVMQQGKSATDKTVKIPEVRRPGYGVRNEKPPPAMQKLPPRQRSTKPQEEIPKKTQPQFNVPTEKDEPTSMMKLLSGDYEKEWYAKRAEMEKSLPRPPNKATNSAGQPDDRRKPLQGNDGSARRMVAAPGRSPADADKEMFKMERFKNIPSKIDSHQRAEVMAAAK